MTPVKKNLEKAEADENSDEEVVKKPLSERKSNSEGQLTQLEATFTLDKVRFSLNQTFSHIFFHSSKDCSTH